MRKVYAFGIPFIDVSSRKKRRNADKFLDEVIRPLNGFVGVNFVENRGIALLFDTENDAKIGRNVLESHGVPCGRDIVPAEIDNDKV